MPLPFLISPNTSFRENFFRFSQKKLTKSYENNVSFRGNRCENFCESESWCENVCENENTCENCRENENWYKNVRKYKNFREKFWNNKNFREIFCEYDHFWWKMSLIKLLHNFWEVSFV
jgi:hypothetical protein